MYECAPRRTRASVVATSVLPSARAVHANRLVVICDEAILIGPFAEGRRPTHYGSIDGRAIALSHRRVTGRYGPLGLDEPDTRNNLAQRSLLRGLFRSGFDGD